MVDGSKVNNADFTKVKQFLTNFVKDFNISPAKSRLGILQYSFGYLAQVVLRFSSSQAKSDILEDIDYMNYQEGSGRYTGQALQAVENGVCTNYRFLLRILFIAVKSHTFYSSNLLNFQCAISNSGFHHSSVISCLYFLPTDFYGTSWR